MKLLNRKIQSLMAMALGSVPVAVLLFFYLCPALLPWAWVWAGAYLLLSAAGLRMPGKWRLLYGILLTAAGLTAAVLLGRGVMLPVMVATVFYEVLFLWSLTIGGWHGDWELPPLFRIGCFVIHLVGQAAVFVDGLGQQAFGVHGTLLRAACMAYLLLTVLSLNRESMDTASGGHRTVSRTIRRKNTAMTLGLFGLGIAASFIPKIYDWLKMLIANLVALVLWLLSHLLPEQQTGTPGGSEGMPGGLPPVEETEQSLLSRILELVGLVLGGLLLLGLLCKVLVFLWRKLKQLLRWLWGRLEGYAAAVSEDYQDEITDTRRDHDGASRFGTKRREQKSRNRKEPMSPGERIRYRYLRLLRKHPNWTVQTTARENIPPELASLYERARYSAHTPTEGEAEQFRTGTKNL